MQEDKTMTLAGVVSILERVAGMQPAVRMCVRNDVFRLNAFPDARYGAFAWLQGQHQRVGDLQRYSFTLFYVDRLTEDKGNEIEVQSTAIEVLTNVIKRLEDFGVYTSTAPTFTAFNQRFADECAGAFCSVTFEAPAEITCPAVFGDYNKDFNADFWNGLANPLPLGDCAPTYNVDYLIY